jgi:hypothetical protein
MTVSERSRRRRAAQWYGTALVLVSAVALAAAGSQRNPGALCRPVNPPVPCGDGALTPGLVLAGAVVAVGVVAALVGVDRRHTAFTTAALSLATLATGVLVVVLLR